jgi:predicted phage-related endonuclease
MKAHLLFTPTIDMTREVWLSHRHAGIGASEVGAVLGLDDYMSSLELYYYKIGDAPRFDIERMAAFMGRELEDMIAQLWQFWDPHAMNGEDSMIENFRAGRLVRKCRRVNAYVRNPAYPWLFVSLDRIINKHGSRGEGTLELKTISGFEADKWEAELPPKYVTQVNTQMAVCEFDYGEMAILRDGRRFNVLPFEISPSIVQHVITRTKAFWDRVTEARKLVNEKHLPAMRFNQRRLDELNAEIDKLAPEPDGTLAYANYLKERNQQATYAERRGNAIEHSDAIQHLDLTDRIKELGEKKQLYENRLKVALADHQVLDFGPEGKVYWTNTQAGGRIFRNRVKKP